MNISRRTNGRTAARRASWAVAGLLVIAAAGCATDERSRTPATSASPPTGDAAEAIAPAPTPGGVAPGVAAMREVMAAKLRHAHALFDAVTLEDPHRVEQSARELIWLSRQASWKVDATDEYEAASEQFRAACQQLITSAKRDDWAAAADDHMAVTAACTACHRYLRREGLLDSLPQAVSRRPGAGPRRPVPAQGT